MELPLDPGRRASAAACLVAAAVLLVACSSSDTPTRSTTTTRRPHTTTTVASSPSSTDRHSLQPASAAPGPWKLRFHDEFDGTSIDLDKWRPNWLASDDDAITKPVNKLEVSCYDPAQVAVSDGTLQLSAVRRSCTAVNGVTYGAASGLIESDDHYTFTHGYLEARMWLDGSTTWPAFWADGTGDWPTTGELDVMENLDGELCWHFHSPNNGPGGCATTPPSGWHTFGADWERGSVTFFYDGVQVGRITKGITSSPMFVIVNLGLKSVSSAPANIQVDWVRVWQH